MGNMDDEHRKRLGQEVIARRTELGMTTTKALADKAKLSPRMLGDVENGRRQNFSAGAKAQIEHALDWMYGSIDDVLAGAHPTVVVSQPRTPRQGGTSIQVDLTAIPGDALLEELRRRMRSDLEYLSSKPVGRWTGLIELVEREVDDGLDNETSAGASPEERQAQEAASGPSAGKNPEPVRAPWSADTPYGVGEPPREGLRDHGGDGH